MSLLSININQYSKLSLKEVKLPAPKERELKPLEPILKDKVIKNAVVIEKKTEPNIKSLWDILDSSSQSFWRFGGRGGEVGFTTFENNKKY